MINKTEGKRIAVLINRISVAQDLIKLLKAEGNTERESAWRLVEQETIVELADMGIPMVCADYARDYINSYNEVHHE